MQEIQISMRLAVRIHEPMLHLKDQCFYSCLRITPDLRCQKRLGILCFSTTSIKIWRSGTFFAFSPLHLSEPLRKQKVVVCDLWLVDFDPFCMFLCFKVRCFVFENRRKNYQAMFVYRSDLGQNLCHFFFLPYFTNIFCIFFLQDKFHPSSIQDDQSTRFPSTTNYKKKNNIKRLLWRIHYQTGLFSQVNLPLCSMQGNNGPWAKTFEKIIF